MRGEHPVELIAVRNPIAACLECVVRLDWQDQKSVSCNEFSKSLEGTCCLIECAETIFCCDLSCRGGTDENDV